MRIELGRPVQVGFAGLSDDEQREWVEDVTAKVAHVPSGGEVRHAVAGLLDELVADGRGCRRRTGIPQSPRSSERGSSSRCGRRDDPPSDDAVG